MLEKIIQDKKLAWDRTLRWDDAVIEFSKDKLMLFDEVIESKRRSETLENEILNLKKNFLDNGPGFVIIEGLNKYIGNETELEKVLLYISNILGKAIPQNKQGELVKRVFDRGTKIEQKGRYSESRYGGDLHTDGAEIPYPVPKYLPLLCVRQAKSGGLFQIVSAYSMHNKLLKEDKTVLKRLYEDFYWDRRGDLGPNGEETFLKPVFSYKNNELCCSYLRTYINEGHRKEKKNLNELDISALNSMDKLLEDSSLVTNYLMKPGQLMISNNHFTLHGRTTFEDYAEDDKKRLLLRTWVIKN